MVSHASVRTSTHLELRDGARRDRDRIGSTEEKEMQGVAVPSNELRRATVDRD
jgi:hypothetical protein